MQYRSIENWVGNQDSILNCCVSILNTWFLWDSSNQNGLCTRARELALSPYSLFFPVNYNHNFWLPKVKLPYSCLVSWVLNLEIFVIWEKSRNLILAKIKIMKFNTRYRSISDVEVYEQNKDLHIMSNNINIIRPL